jgi:lipopolysaccharide export system permease protein
VASAHAAATAARRRAAADPPRGGGVRILDRYLLREFAGYLLLGLAGFIAIWVVVDFIEKADIFLEHHASLPLLGEYYLSFTPQIVVTILPVALMLATFLALGQLNKFGELTAMRAAGISLVRILAPVFAVAAASTLTSLALSEVVLPRSTRHMNVILNERIQHMTSVVNSERADVTYLGQGGRIWYTRLYMVRERRMHEVSLQEFRGGQLWRRIDAAEASWDGRRWVFSSGYLRTFEHGHEKADVFARMAVGGLGERPADFEKDDMKPDEMNYAALRAYIIRLRASGARVANYLVDLHLKLAFPLICFIVVMIGGSLATRLRMQSAALGFGLTLAVSFLYYIMMRAGQALGHNGALPPYVAAWIGDTIFGAAGALMMYRAQRS